MGRIDLPFDRPSCSCGRPAWFQRHGAGLVKRGDRLEDSEWWRFICRDYRKGTADNHFHGTVDSEGRRVELTNRKPRETIKGRPPCSECHGLLTARSFKNTVQGRGRYFVCTNPDCVRQGGHQLHLQKGSRWTPVELPRGPKPKDFGIGKCPECGRSGTLRSQGHFKGTEQYKQPLPRIQCQRCKTRFRLLEYGKLEKAPAPGFQRKHDPPRCPVHGRAMERGPSKVRNGIRLYRWRCSRTRCQKFVLLDNEGRPTSSDQARVDEARVNRRHCALLGCREPRVDQLDGRKRYCVEHSKLSYFQRWKVKRDRRAAIVRQGQLVLGGTARKAKMGAIEFGGWLAEELGLLGETHRSAARRTGIPWKTIYNWLAGISMPAQGDPQLIHLLETLGIDPNRFAVRLATA
jgi:hypothetical protein